MRVAVGLYSCIQSHLDRQTDTDTRKTQQTDTTLDRQAQANLHIYLWARIKAAQQECTDDHGCPMLIAACSWERLARGAAHALAAAQRGLLLALALTLALALKLAAGHGFQLRCTCYVVS